MKSPYLMHLSVSLGVVIPRQRLLFKYEGRLFKFESIFSNQYADHLSTIVDEDDADMSDALKKATDWANGFAHVAHSSCSVAYSGGTPASTIPLEKHLSKSFGFRHCLAATGHGHDLGSVLDIKNDDQSRGLQVFQLGRCASDIYHEFLSYWQVLEVKLGRPNPSTWIDGLSKKSLSEVDEQIFRLPIGSNTLGNYLYEDCRNAIAHLRRRPGYTSLDFCNAADRRRMLFSVAVVRHLAELYLRDVLNIQGRKWLYRVAGERFPVYHSEAKSLNGSIGGFKLPRPTQKVKMAIARMERGLDCGLEARSRRSH